PAAQQGLQRVPAARGRDAHSELQQEIRHRATLIDELALPARVPGPSRHPGRLQLTYQLLRRVTVDPGAIVRSQRQERHVCAAYRPRAVVVSCREDRDLRWHATMLLGSCGTVT